jgi:hypothetical protein
LSTFVSLTSQKDSALARVELDQIADPAQDVRDARLTSGSGKHTCPSIPDPAVSDDRSIVITPDQRFRLHPSTTARDPIEALLPCSRHEQPGFVSSDLPSRLVGREHRSTSDLNADPLVCRFDSRPQARYRSVQSRPARPQSEALVQQIRDPLERHPALFVQLCGKCRCPRTDLNCRRSHHSRGLLDMTCSQLSFTVRASCNVDYELSGRRILQRNVGLPLSLLSDQLRWLLARWTVHWRRNTAPPGRSSPARLATLASRNVGRAFVPALRDRLSACPD